MMRSKIATGLTALGVLLALSACSSGATDATTAPAADTVQPTIDVTTSAPVPSTSDAPGPDTASPTETATATPSVDQVAALTAAVAAYTDAFFAADFDTAVMGMWSPRCLANDKARNDAVGGFAALKVKYPDGSERPTAQNITVDRLDGSAAVVTYDYASSIESGTVTSQPWVLEGSRWKFDAC